MIPIRSEQLRYALLSHLIHLLDSGELRTLLEAGLSPDILETLRAASARDLASALIKLYRENASTLTPDPLHSAFYDSHPPAIARIGKLQKAQAASGKR